MAEEELRLPSDVEIHMWQIQVEHLTTQYDIMKAMFIKHEVELALLWCLAIGLGVGFGVMIYHQDKERDVRLANA